jgi:hypothetical protein
VNIRRCRTASASSAGPTNGGECAPTTFAPANIQPDLVFPFPDAATTGATANDQTEKRRDQRVFQCRLRLGHFRAHVRFAKAFDDQPGLDDEVDPPAQRSVEPGNTERLCLLALLLRYIFKPKGIDPSVSRIKIATDLDCPRRAVGLPQDAAMRRDEARMQK